MKNKLFLLMIIFIVSIFYSCEETTQPTDSNELKLVLKADKTSGTVPLTINFTAEIKGDTTGFKGLVPDYFFYPGGGRTIIRYALPDTLQKSKPGQIKKLIMYLEQSKLFYYTKVKRIILLLTYGLILLL